MVALRVRTDGSEAPGIIIFLCRSFSSAVRRSYCSLFRLIALSVFAIFCFSLFFQYFQGILNPYDSLELHFIMEVHNNTIRSFASKIACKCRTFNIFLFLISPKICLGEIFSEVHINYIHNHIHILLADSFRLPFTFTMLVLFSPL